MRLDRVSIKNFRSIQKLTIEFQPRCRVLVGINEAGKTNILHALALLSRDREIRAEDRREVAPDEDRPRESYVRFVFALEKRERQQIYESLISKVHSSDPLRPIVSRGGQEMSLAQLCEKTTEVLFVADIMDRTHNVTVWKAPDDQQVVPDWYSPAANCPATVQITSTKGQGATVNSYSLLHADDCGAIPSAYLVRASSETVQDLVHNAVMAYARANLPLCVFWQHSEDHLIPARINRDTFSSDPNTCLPLKHAFVLAAVDDIPSAFVEAQETSNGLRNLLTRVAKQATRYIHDVWPEYKELRLDLRENGNNIVASIVDVHNSFDLASRSDGFKRFMAFLLMISAPSKTKKLTNVLILHDDPDTGMHPSSARHLRDELIRVSKENYVVYSTHSIFMIDTEAIGRHLIVRKQKEVTQVSEASESDIVDEEVLHRALGFSFAEMLRPKNVVFEGWKDKLLFRTALRRVPTEFSMIKKAFEGVGLCHVGGVKDVGRVTPFMECAGRTCWIISDGDPPAREYQKQHRTKRLYGEWIRYDELLEDFKPVTAEDFFNPDYVKSTIRAVGKDSYPHLDSAQFSPKQELGTLGELEGYLTLSGLSQTERKDFIHRTKDALFDNAKPSCLRREYYEFLAKLAEKIFGTDLGKECHTAAQERLSDSA